MRTPPLVLTVAVVSLPVVAIALGATHSDTAATVENPENTAIATRDGHGADAKPNMAADAEAAKILHYFSLGGLAAARHSHELSALRLPIGLWAWLAPHPPPGSNGGNQTEDVMRKLAYALLAALGLLAAAANPASATVSLFPPSQSNG